MKIAQLIEDSTIWKGDFTLTGPQRHIHAPRVVLGSCVFVKIDASTLKGSPVEVMHAFMCQHNRLKSLEHGPTIVNGGYDCSFNQLKNLIGAPRKTSVFRCNNNPLTSLEGVPAELTMSFTKSKHQAALEIRETGLTSLQNIHKYVKFAQSIDLRGNKIKKRVLGLLLIDGLEYIIHDADDKAMEVINKWLSKPKTMETVNACQDEMIELDLDEYAEL